MAGWSIAAELTAQGHEEFSPLLYQASDTAETSWLIHQQSDSSRQFYKLGLELSP